MPQSKDLMTHAWISKEVEQLSADPIAGLQVSDNPNCVFLTVAAVNVQYFSACNVHIEVHLLVL